MTQHLMRGKVLLVEDNPGDARLIRELLDDVPSARLELEVVDHLAAACERLPAGGVSVVLLDLNLPDSTGVDTLRQVIAAAPDIPVVVLTGHADQEFAIQAVSSGAQDFVAKGTVEGQTLVRVMQYAIERKRSEQALRESEARYRSLFNSVPAGLSRSLPDGQLVAANEALVAMLSYPDLSTLLGTNVRRLFRDPADYDRVREPLALGGELLQGMMVELLRYDGTVVWVEGNLRALHDDRGELLYYEAAIIDVTERKRMKEAEHEQRVLAEALRDTAAALNTTLDLDEVLDRILEGVGRVLPHDAANIMLLQDYNAYVKRARGYYLEHDLEADLMQLEFCLADIYHMRLMAETGEPCVVQDVAGCQDWVIHNTSSWIRSYVGAPILQDGELIGYINVDSAQPGAFGPEHGERLKAFADQVAVAIRNAQLYEAEQQRRQIAEKLQQASAVLNSTLELEQVFALMLEQLSEVLAYDFATVQQKQDGGLLLQTLKGLDKANDLVGQAVEPADEFPGRQVLVSEKTQAFDNVAALYPAFVERLRQYTDRDVGSWMGVPLVVNGETLGVISIGRLDVQPFTPEEIELVTAFANHAASAMQNARLYAELENYSSILVEAVHDATAELRQALEQRDVILNNSPDAILLLNPDGTVETANLTFYQTFGLAPESIQDVLLTQLVVVADRPDFQHALDTVMKERHPQRFEAMACCSSGATFDADIVLSPVMENHTLLGIVCSLRDVSVLKEVERMKDALVSTAAHELRTPLTTIQGFSELLLARDLGEERRERYLRFINEQSSQLARIVDGLLDISRLEAGHGLDLDSEPVDVGRVVADAVQPFVETSPQHTFHLRGLDTLPPTQADGKRLAQVVKNLVSNAVKYSPEGGTVTVKARHAADSIEISVQDEGIGIAEEHMPRLFEKFYRADLSNTAIGGTGLGLTICKLIVEQHAGRIWVESAPGEGSIFWFTVPLRPGGEASAERTAS